MRTGGVVSSKLAVKVKFEAMTKLNESELLVRLPDQPRNLQPRSALAVMVYREPNLSSFPL